MELRSVIGTVDFQYTECIRSKNERVLDRVSVDILGLHALMQLPASSVLC